MPTAARLTVTLSRNLTDRECRQKAQADATAWTRLLAAKGATGEFVLSHGGDLPCADAHDTRVNKGIWIHTGPWGTKCKVFVTRHGNPQWFVGRTQHKHDWVYAGGCSCGHGH